MSDQEDISDSSTSSEDSVLDISKLKRGLSDSAMHEQLKARLKKPPDAAVDVQPTDSSSDSSESSERFDVQKFKRELLETSCTAEDYRKFGLVPPRPEPVIQKDRQRRPPNGQEKYNISTRHSGSETVAITSEESGSMENVQLFIDQIKETEFNKSVTAADFRKGGIVAPPPPRPIDKANASESKVRLDLGKEVTPRRSESRSECDQRKVPGKQRVSHSNNVKANASASTTKTSNNSHKNGQSSSLASDRKSSSRGSTSEMSISKSPKPGTSTSQKNFYLHSTPIDKRFEGPKNLDFTPISVIQRPEYLTAPRQVSEQPKRIASFDSFKKPELVTSRKQKKNSVQNVTMTMVTPILSSTRVATPRPPKSEPKPFTRTVYETFSSQKSDTESASYVSKSKIPIAEQSKKLSIEQSTKSKRLSTEGTDQSKGSIIDQSKRSSTDQRRSSTDESKRSSTDQSKRSSINQSKRSSTNQSRANVSETSSSITTNTSAKLWDFKRNVTQHIEKIPGNSKSNIFQISSGETGENSSTGSSLQNEVIPESDSVNETLQPHSGPKAKAKTEKSVLTQENLEQENNSDESLFSSHHSSGCEDIPVSSKHITLERLEQLREEPEIEPIVFTHVTSQPDLEEVLSIFAKHSSQTGRDSVSKKSSECSSWSSGDDAVVKNLKNAKVDSVLCESDSGKESDSHSLNEVVNSPHQKRLLSKSKRNERSGITGTISSSSDASENDVIALNSPPTQSSHLMQPSSKSNGRPDESSHSGDINAISKKSATSDLRKSVRKETCSVPSEKTSQGSQKQNAIMTKDLEPKFVKAYNTRPSLKPVVVLERMGTRNSKRTAPKPVERPSEDSKRKSSPAVIVNKGLNKPAAALPSLQENSPTKDSLIEGVSVPEIVISKRPRAPSGDSGHSLQDNPSDTSELQIGHSQPTSHHSKSSSTKLKPKAIQKLNAHIIRETESPEERARPILRVRTKRRKGGSGASVSQTSSFNPSQIYAPFVSSRFLDQNQSSTSVAVGGAEAPNRFENVISSPSTLEKIPEMEIEELLGAGVCDEASSKAEEASSSSEEEEQQMTNQDLMKLLAKRAEEPDIQSRLVRTEKDINLFSKEDYARYVLTNTGDDLTPDQAEFMLKKTSEFCVGFINDLCKNASLPGGVFTYQDLRKALLKENLIEDRNNEPFSQINAFFTAQQMKKISGILVPKEDSEVWDTFLDWQE